MAVLTTDRSSSVFARHLARRAPLVAVLPLLCAPGCGSGSDASSGGDAGSTGVRDALEPDGSASPAAASPDADSVADAPSIPEIADAADASDDTGAVDAAIGIQGPETFHGVNWADARDNFVNGLLQLSGLDTTADTYATVQAKTTQIVSQFRTKLGANTIRIPINEPTVAGAWWNAYKAVIDTATAQGVKVMIAYWAYQNGKPDDEAAFKAMWQTVVSAYATNDLVYFDIHNEPYGFGSSWNDEAAKWLGYFASLPKGRVIVAGTGYDDNVTAVGGDTRFAGYPLEFHIYGFQHTAWTTQKQWTDAFNAAIGSYASRTIVGEWGDTMNSGIDYDTDASDGNNALSYVTTMASYVRGKGMGSCYWPGLRSGDGYSMTKLAISGTTLTLSVVNASGLDRLRWSWNL
jgi:endoglucanase